MKKKQLKNIFVKNRINHGTYSNELNYQLLAHFQHSVQKSNWSAMWDGVVFVRTVWLSRVRSPCPPPGIIPRFVDPNSPLGSKSV